MFPIHEFISLFVTSDNDVDSNLNGVDEDKLILERDYDIFRELRKI